MTLTHARRCLVLAAAATAACAAAVSPVRAADRAEPLPKELEGVGIVQKPGAQLPLDLPFRDENGDEAPLRRWFSSGRPVLFNLGYYSCPMLCNLVLNGLVDGIKPLSYTPGQDFDIVMVSINPNETPDLAGKKRDNYIESYGRPGTTAGWHFLTGHEEDIKKLAAAVGFGYRYVPEDHQYAHAAGIFVVTPDGKVSRLLTGIQFEPRTLRLALAEASHGKIGSALDQVLLFCFHYDANSGRYALAATRLMQAGGAATAAIVGLALATFWIKDRRRRKADVPETTA